MDPRTDAVDTRYDGWGNVLTGLGIRSTDKRLASEIQSPDKLSQSELEDMYAGDGLARRICDLPANEQTRKWIKVNADKDVGKQTLQSLQSLGAQDAVTEALVWARLYGGAVVLLGANDGADPAVPLNDNRIKSIDWLTVLHRHEIEVMTKYADPFQPKYGQPETYRIITSVSGGVQQAIGKTFHESRCIRFDGVRTPRERIERNNGWCDPIFVAIHGAIRDTWAAFDGASALLSDFSQAVYKVKGLANLVGSNQDETLIKRLQIIDTLRSILRAVVIDADGEDFERKTTSLSGFPEVLDRIQQLLSAVTGIPVTLLMGRSPAGMNATGESDIRVFYDSIQSEQENHLRPKLERLFYLIFRAKNGPTRGREPKDWSFSFNPLWQLTDKETADVRKVQADSDAIYITNGVVLPEEIRQSRFSGDAYSSETIINEDFDDIGATDDGSSNDDQDLTTPENDDASNEHTEE